MAEEKKKTKSLLFSCLVVTVGLHLAFVTYLFRHPLFFEPSFATAWTKGMVSKNTPPSTTKRTKSLVLGDALSHIVLFVPKDNSASSVVVSKGKETKDPQLQADVATPIYLSKYPQPNELALPCEELLSSTSSIHFPQVKESIKSNLTPFSNPLPSFNSSPLSAKIDLNPPSHKIERLPQEECTLVASGQQAAHPESTNSLYKGCSADELLYLATGFDERSSSIFAQKPLKEQLAPLIGAKASIPLLQDNPLCARGAQHGGLAAIEAYLPEEPGLSFSDWSNYFHLDYIFLPREEGQEYRFALTLSPKDDLSTIQMKQNFYFLIDRSNSIEKHRFTGYKKAVERALDMLTPEQTFNICIFDRKNSLFSKTPLNATQKNILQAKQFLESKEYTGTFAAGELFHTLTKFIPKQAAANEMHIAILLSDGNSSLSNQKQKEALRLFLKENHRQLSLYAATCGQGNDLSLLKVLTTQTGGDLLFSPTHAAFARKLAKFVRTLSAPLANEISTVIQVANEHVKVKLLTPSSHLPALYNHLPYTLYGAMSEPTTITLTLEGLHKQQPIVIQKEIPFERPLNKSPQLEKEWLEQLSLNQWGKYLKTGKKEDLLKAKAFQDEAAAVKLRRVRSP